MTNTRPFALLLALGAALPSPALPAQDDLRDRVVTTDGRTLEGRVAEPFAPGHLLLVQGGKRLRIPRAEVASTDTVAARLQEFGERRRALRQSPRAQWFLVEWAQSRGLPGLARLQALAVVLADDSHEEAHRFLGHTPSARGWLWEHRGRRHLREQFEAQLQKQPLELAGERFVLRCDGGLRANVDALLDLEALGVAWFATFGGELQLREVLRPIRIVVGRSVDSFEKWGFRPVPYFVPPPHGDEGRTFFAGPSPARPERLFFVGVQGLLHRCLIGDVDAADDRDRTVPWLEVGLGSWFEARMQGDVGYATFGAPTGENLVALQALAGTPKLPALLQTPMYGGFYLADDAPTAANWAAAQMFVAWLLSGEDPHAARASFVVYARAALADGKGTSSSHFDTTMGRKVESCEAPWRDWLGRKSRE